MKQRFKNEVSSTLLLLGAYLIWGCSAFAVTLFPDIDAISLIWARSFFGSFVIISFLALKRIPVKQIFAAKEYWKEILAVSIAGIGTFGFMTAGVQYGSVSTTIFLLYTAPIFVTVFSRYILKERIQERDLIPLHVATIGLVFMFSNILNQSIEIGSVFGLLGGIFWGAQIIFSKQITRKVDSVIVTFWAIVLNVFMVAPLVNYASIGESNVLQLMVYGVMVSGIAPLLFYAGIRMVKAHVAGLMSLIDPVENSLLAFGFAGEVPTLGTFIGGIFILGSMVVQAVESNNKK